MERPVFVVAEAGVNHNGDLSRALDMVEVAVHCGADAIKFQTFVAERLATARAMLVDYQSKSRVTANSQLAMLSNLELDATAHMCLVDRCNELGISFMSTAFDVDSLSLVLDCNVSVLKVPSGELTNLPLLRQIAASKKQIFLSTGMATLQEVQAAVAALENGGALRDDITILHCTTDYPTDPKDVNMRAITTLASELGLKVGYSDHTRGNEAAVAAVALGAVVVEKHFTLDRALEGPDHQASLLPDELESFISAIRRTSSMLGSGIKEPAEVEMQARKLVRKSIVACRPITAGEIYRDEMLTTKRPGDGVSPMMWDEIVGTAAGKDYDVDEKIEL